MWNNTCKTCSDYMFCKDDVLSNKKRLKKERKKKNESKSNKKLSRQNNRQMV